MSKEILENKILDQTSYGIPGAQRPVNLYLENPNDSGSNTIPNDSQNGSSLNNPDAQNITQRKRKKRKNKKRRTFKNTIGKSEITLNKKHKFKARKTRKEKKKKIRRDNNIDSNDALLEFLDKKLFALALEAKAQGKNMIEFLYTPCLNILQPIMPDMITDIYRNESKNKKAIKLLEMSITGYIKEELIEHEVQKNGHRETIIFNEELLVEKLLNTIEKCLKYKESGEGIPEEFNNIGNSAPSVVPENLNTQVEVNNRNSLDSLFNHLEEPNTAEETHRIMLQSLETNINNERIDILFDRLKSMIIESFIEAINSKVNENDKFPNEISNFLVNIKGKRNNNSFWNIDFKDNLLYFVKDDKEKEIIEALIKRLYNEKEKNKEAIDLLEKSPLEFIYEILSNEEKKEIFFDKDRQMKVKEVQNKKCRIILSDLEQSNNSDNLLQLRGFTKKKYDYNQKHYITFYNIGQFLKSLKELGFDGFSLELTNNEKKKIGERLEILENLARDPMLYLSSIVERRPRNSGKKEN